MKNSKQVVLYLIFYHQKSPKITKIHSIDPTFETFVINTTQRGDFSHILNLINFKPNNISENELPFISEVVDLLENESIQLLFDNNSTEITEDNVFDEISQHEKYGKFYSKRLLSEIEFISSHFYELFEKHENELGKLKIETLLEILNNSKLKLIDEDQLLNFVNHLYVNDKKFSVLYETVCFANASSKSVSEFVDVYDINDVTQTAWSQISVRLIQEISSKINKNERYMRMNKGTDFPYQSGNEFSGIINYLNSNCNGNIDNVINFTASSNDWDSRENYKPHSVAFFNDSNRYFVSGCKGNEWLCLDFKKHKIIPTHYTIRSSNYEVGNWHPKSWVIEVSNDNKNWIEIDNQQNCTHLNGPRYVHTFSISKKQYDGFQYIRIRQLENCSGSKYFAMEKLEIYGTLL